MARHHFTRRKYANEPTEIDGFKFDSRKEARRYVALRTSRDEGAAIARPGHEDGVVLQFVVHAPRFVCPSARQTGKPVTYTADFLVFWTDGVVTIEDTKGVRTEAYVTKKLLVERLYSPLTITEL